MIWLESLLNFTRYEAGTAFLFNFDNFCDIIIYFTKIVSAFVVKTDFSEISRNIIFKPEK